MGGEELQKWWIDEQLNDKRVVKIEQYVANNIREINVKLDELESMLSQKNSSLDIEITKLYSDLRSQFSDEPDQQKIADLRTNAKLRLEKVTALRENYLETWITFKKKVLTRNKILKKLEQIQHQITGIRANKIEEVKKKLNLFTNDKLKINIHMVPSGDREEFRKAFTPFLRSRSIRAEQKLIDLISSHFTPLEFCCFVIQEKIEEMKNIATDLTDNQISKLKENWRLC